MNIDANINHYTDAELESLYNLQPGYTISQVLEEENSIYKKMVMTVTDESKRKQIMKMLKKITKRLSKPFTQNPKRVDVPVEKYIFSADSAQRIIGQKIHDFTFLLLEPIEIKSLQIHSLDIHIYWYEFQKAMFYCNDIPVYIPDGTYSSDELATILKTTADITLTLRSHTTLSYTQPFTVDFGKHLKTTGWIMGFRRDSYKGEYNAITSMYEIHSEAPYGHLNELLYIDVIDYSEQFTSEQWCLDKSKHIMACLPVINHQRLQYSNGPIRKYVVPTSIKRLRIQLFNKSGEPFLLKNDYSIQFSITK